MYSGATSTNEENKIIDLLKKNENEKNKRRAKKLEGIVMNHRFGKSFHGYRQSEYSETAKMKYEKHMIASLDGKSLKM
jgi:hypothetical protein